jgi:hypothetical protein
MANMLANSLGGALAQHSVTLGNNAGDTVTYARGGLSVSLAATKCQVRSEADLQFGILRINECDWIIKASLLVLGAATVEPQESKDTITESDGTVWQVLPNTGEQAFRPLDPYKTAWRIHTKRIEA